MTHSARRECGGGNGSQINLVTSLVNCREVVSSESHMNEDFMLKSFAAVLVAVLISTRDIPCDMP